MGQKHLLDTDGNFAQSRRYTGAEKVWWEGVCFEEAARDAQDQGGEEVGGKNGLRVVMWDGAAVLCRLIPQGRTETRRGQQ